jgi:NADH-quinone oxidoreductase subunit I/NAD(P)H-quinone oxidoreductase subunit I
VLHFFQDIYLGMKTFLAGMKVTAVYFKDANLHPGQTVTTIAYDGTMPLAKEVKVADRFRGHLHLDTGNCVACKSCMKVCPIDCIWIDTEKTEGAKQRVSRFEIDQLKCMYCGQCVRACPTGGLTMSHEWWGASFHLDDGTNLHGQLRTFGQGYYTDEQKLEVERKRQAAAEAKKKPAAPPPAETKAESPAPATPPAEEKKPEPPPPPPPAPAA